MKGQDAMGQDVYKGKELLDDGGDPEKEKIFQVQKGKQEH